MELLLVICIVAAVLALVLYPVLAKDAGPAARAEVEAEVEEYRAALRAGTICQRCYRANPEGSRFCAECGRPL